MNCDKSGDMQSMTEKNELAESMKRVKDNLDQYLSISLLLS